MRVTNNLSQNNPKILVLLKYINESNKLKFEIVLHSMKVLKMTIYWVSLTLDMSEDRCHKESH